MAIGGIDKMTLKQGFNDIVDTDKKLALAILEAAKLEAEAGDVSALVFLVVDGQTLEDLLIPDMPVDKNEKPVNSPVLEFCKRTWVKVLKGELTPKWAGIEMSKELTLFGLSVPGVSLEDNEPFDNEF